MLYFVSSWRPAVVGMVVAIGEGIFVCYLCLIENYNFN